MTKPAVSFRHVSKTFPRHSGRMLVKHHLKNLLQWKRSSTPFYALNDVSFDIAPGEGLAVIGSNGAGKSTLLGLVVGLMVPDAGSVEVNGRIAALLELGSGFHADLTGRENVFLNASLMGLTERQTKTHFDSIVEFSGVGEFIEEPLRTYSSGMVLRLAFSVAVNLDPDILIVDEVLAVGDAAFQAKSFEKIQDLRLRGKTFVCVSHAPGMLRGICQTAIWLDHGRMMMTGPIDEVLAAYSGQPVAAT